MTIRLYANGTGGTLGDELVTGTELYTSDSIYFVHHTGSNSNNGQSRQKPWASLVYALTIVGDRDVIVLLDGHKETISTPQTLLQNGLKIVADGSSNGEPTVELKSGLTNQSMLTLAGTSLTLGNIKFKGGSTQTSTSRVAVTGTRSMVRGCYFECDEALSGASLGALSWSVFATGARLFSTKFVVTSTTLPPAVGLASQGPANCEMEDCTFDGGSVGFVFGGYLDYSLFAANAPPQRLRCQQMRLLNGASFVSGDDTIGYVGIAETTGASYVRGFSRKLPNGFRKTGDAMLADIEFYMSGTPYYVHYGTGNNANSGTDELNPKKTIQSAVSVAGDDCDFIVLLPGHLEPMSAGVALGGIGVTLIGCGTSGGKPSCRIYGNVEGPLSVLTTSQTCYVRNLWISENTVTGTTQTKQLGVSVNYSEVRGCLFSLGYRDRVGVVTTIPRITIRDSKFESTGTGATTRPERGLLLDTGTTADVDIRGCQFSNGIGGFLNYSFHGVEVVSRLYAISLTQSFGADIFINASSNGLMNPETSSGSASVEW